MKTFISDLIPKLQRYSQKLDNLTLLTDQHWVVIDDISNNKNVYIFRTNNDLLISQNGKVEKVKWEYLGNNSLLISSRGWCCHQALQKKFLKELVLYFWVVKSYFKAFYETFFFRKWDSYSKINLILSS
ncbi:MAG: hypothetical protein M9892_08545 [Bacteroidetes bacterium]|nr:hypothetical protein [Bacteroidota bacterium]